MNIHSLTPFIRYALIALSSHLVSRGWMGAEDANSLANDPAVIELVVGLVMGAGTLAWYLYSRSRAALKSWLQ